MTRHNPWISLGWDAWNLSLEASSVIGLRTLKLAAGGAAAQEETDRMIREKVEAGFSLQAKAMSGALGLTPAAIASRTLAHYRRKVRANRRRLSRA